MTWAADEGWAEFWAGKGAPFDEYPTAHAWRERYVTEGFKALMKGLSPRRPGA